MAVTYEPRRRTHRTKGSEILSRGSVQVHGESIFYEASGMAEFGPTVLFLHESGGSASTWHGQLTGLAAGARCVVPDLPGHGRSEGAGRSSVQEYSRSVLAFLDALAIRWPVVVAGVCLGAAIAADLALRAPGRVAGLVLCGVSEGGRACEETLSAVGRGEAQEGFVTGLFGSEASTRLRSQRLQQWKTTSPLVRHADLVALAGYPLATALREVTAPSLLVSGEMDPIATPVVAQSLVAAMFDAHSVCVPRAGCLGMAEQPAAFNREVTSFLQRLRPVCPIDPTARHSGGYRRF